MKDCVGNELTIGDKVVTTYVYRNKGAYTSHNATNLAKATVIGFSKLKIRLEVDNPKSGTKEITTKYSDQVSKIYEKHEKIGIENNFNALKESHPEMIEDVISEINSMISDWNY